MLIAPRADPHTHPAAGPLAACIAGGRCIDVEGGMVTLPDQMPARFAGLVTWFLLG